jgi:uncharacterized membrane protein YeiB
MPQANSVDKLAWLMALDFMQGRFVMVTTFLFSTGFD